MLIFLKRYWFVFIFSFLFLIPKSYCMPQASSSVSPMYVGGSWSYLSKYSVSAVYYGSNRVNGYYLGANSGNNDTCHNDRNYYTNASWNCFLVSRDFGRMGEFDLDYMPHGYALYQILNGNVNNNTVIYDLDYNVDIENQTWPEVGQTVELIFAIGLYNFVGSSLPSSDVYINPNQLSLGLMKTDYSGLINITGSSYNLHIYQDLMDIVLDDPDTYGCMNTNGSCSSAQNVKAIRYVTTYFTFNWTQELDSLVKSGSYTAFRVTKSDNSSSSLVAGYGDFLGDVFRPVLTLEGSNLSEYVIDFTNNKTLYTISFPHDIDSSRIYFKDCLMASTGAISSDVSYFNATFHAGYFGSEPTSGPYKSLDLITYNHGTSFTPHYRSYVDFKRSDMDFIFMFIPDAEYVSSSDVYNPILNDDSDKSSFNVLTPISWAWNWLKGGFNWIKNNIFGIGNNQVISGSGSSGGGSSSGGGVSESNFVSKVYPVSCSIMVDENAIVNPIEYTEDSNGNTIAKYKIYDSFGNVVDTYLNDNFTRNIINDPSSYLVPFSSVFVFNRNVITSFVSSDNSSSQNTWQSFIIVSGFILILFIVLRRFKM